MCGNGSGLHRPHVDRYIFNCFLFLVRHFGLAICAALPELNFENEAAARYDSCYRRHSTIVTRDENSSEDDAADIADPVIAQDARISNEFEDSVREFNDICKNFESGSEFSSQYAKYYS